MICIKADIPKELSEIDDELKAIYHSKDTVCFFILKTRELRNKFIKLLIILSPILSLFSG